MSEQIYKLIHAIEVNDRNVAHTLVDWIIDFQEGLYTHEMEESCKQGDYEAVSYYLNQRHISVSEKHVENAAMYNQLTILELLLQYASHTDAFKDKVMNIFCTKGYLPAIKWFVKKYSYSLKDAIIPFCLATRRGHINILEYLLEQGINKEDAVQAARRWAEKDNQVESLLFFNTLDDACLNE